MPTIPSSNIVTMTVNLDKTASLSSMHLGNRGDVLTIRVVVPTGISSSGYDAYLDFIQPDGKSYYKGAYDCSSGTFDVIIGSTDTIMDTDGNIIWQFVLASTVSLVRTIVWVSNQYKSTIQESIGAVLPTFIPYVPSVIMLDGRNVSYSGLATGDNITDAIDDIFTDLTNLSFTGSEHDALVTAALVDSEGVDFGSTGLATNLEGRLNKWERITKDNGVNVRLFGAIQDGVTDDTVAIQTAVDYCVLNSKDLVIGGICKITDSIIIDREVDNPLYDNYFTILSNTGGGFIISTPIPMFTSSYAFTTSPVSQLIRFQNLLLISTYGASGSYVMDNARYLRTVFIGCSFVGIQCLSSTVALSQSIYFDNCNMRRITGIFFNNSFICYDIKVHNCLCEAGEEWFHIGIAVGCSFVQNCMEGSASHTALTFEASQGLEISGNYFEANQSDIDFTGNDIDGTLGVNLSGNYFTQVIATEVYHVKWNVSRNCVSHGNYCNGHLHYLTTQTQTEINDYSNFPISNIPISNHYTEFILGNTTGNLLRIGNSKLIAADIRTVGVDTNFADIDLKYVDATAVIRIVCSGLRKTIEAISQIEEWYYIAGTLTSKLRGGGVDVIATLSGDFHIILSYDYSGSIANYYTTEIEVTAMSSYSNVNLVPSITIL